MKGSFSFLLFFLCSLGGADAIKITRLDVPLFVDPRSPKVALRCEYDLEDLALYTVKWYRNDQEFFCYTPGATLPGQVFNVTGVKVDLARSNAEEVILMGQTGRYHLNQTPAIPIPLPIDEKFMKSFFLFFLYTYRRCKPRRDLHLRSLNRGTKLLY